ncbi:DNA polymerase III subunit chi [Frigidibacter sp. SD6-1]|uniref:DNA polymerase III subunit chi n=1 Tax=Frigidibacter sp. SD6-1 TaxID=3032581 RepID=UPI0024E034CA|nr:DNA polymerase III subunit chi [Frigidibacter sp. SD6-1]
MGAVFFYHLTRSAPEAAVAMLADRAAGQGWRAAVRLREAARADWLDQKLWLGPEDGFLPHGIAGGPHDALQPLLLTASPDLPDGVRFLMALDGAEVTPAEVTTLDRAAILFDGNDPTAVETARTQWRTLTAAGLEAQYWSEESGRWQKKAEAGPASGR